MFLEALPSSFPITLLIISAGEDKVILQVLQGPTLLVAWNVHL